MLPCFGNISNCLKFFWNFICTLFLCNRKNVSDLLLFLIESFHQTFLFFKYFIVLMCTFRGKGCPPSQRKYFILWSWSNRWSGHAWHGCWELLLGLREEQQALSHLSSSSTLTFLNHKRKAKFQRQHILCVNTCRIEPVIISND